MLDISLAKISSPLRHRKYFGSAEKVLLLRKVSLKLNNLPEAALLGVQARKQ